jgi:hypothetical protein
MNKTKFTPGPWIKRGKGTIETSGGAEVASVMDGQMLDRVDHETQEANAHLIAAAPELYEALEELHAQQNGPPLEKYKTRWEKAMRKTEAALAKARGEE